MTEIPDWLWQGLVEDAIWTSFAFGVAYAWRHREKLEDWHHVASYQLTKPFKPPLKTTATVTATAVGRTHSRYDPYTGEYIVSHAYFDKE